MKSDISSNQPAPLPRTDPLIVDRMPPARLAEVQAYIEHHGGIWLMLADGGYLPDGAWLTWYRDGRISPVTGWPQRMSSTITIPK